ncbi:MAG: o-succinylbenzoate synthase [Opitutaceae bacterium]|nr:o-succinylbenzoate synthase [Opitutaceae bacterium]
MSLRLDYRSYSLPLLRPLRTAHGLCTVREGGVVRLVDESGAVGLGEVCPLPGFNRERWSDSESVLGRLGEHVTWETLADLPSDLECLCGALAAARRMLEGGRGDGDRGAPDQPATPPPAWPVASLLPAGKAALGEVDSRLELGFRIFKWKVGVAPVGDEIALLDDLLGRMPEGARLRLDANGAWGRRQAERWLERCAERPIEHVEQPVDAERKGAEDLLLGLADDYPTPLALDESLVLGADITTWLEKGWQGVFVVKPSLLADPEAILGRLERAGAKVVFSSALETAIGARNALDIAFSWGGERRALGFGVWPLFGGLHVNGPHAAPFMQLADVRRLDPQKTWTVLN